MERGRPEAGRQETEEGARMGSAARIVMGERGRRYAHETLSMEALGARMEKMLASAIEEYKVRARA